MKTIKIKKSKLNEMIAEEAKKLKLLNEATNHTPGPWNMSKDATLASHPQFTVYSEKSGKRVATVFETKSNAHLITAAPDMLEALIKCEDSLNAHLNYDDNNSFIDLDRHAVELVRDAINKAKNG